MNIVCWEGKWEKTGEAYLTIYSDGTKFYLRMDKQPGSMLQYDPDDSALPYGNVTSIIDEMSMEFWGPSLRQILPQPLRGKIEDYLISLEA